MLNLEDYKIRTKAAKEKELTRVRQIYVDETDLKREINNINTYYNFIDEAINQMNNMDLMKYILNLVINEYKKQGKEISNQEAEKITEDIVIHNFPICLEKYANGKEWKL